MHESFTAEGQQGARSVSRHLQLGAAKAEQVLLAASRKGAEADAVNDHLGVLRYEVADAPVIVTPNSSRVTAVAVLGGGAKIDASADGQLRVRFAPHDGSRSVRLVYWEGLSAGLAAFQQRLKKLGPADPLAPLTKGGPARWGAPLETEGVVGKGRKNDAYVVDTVTTPRNRAAHSYLRFGAFDFLPDGRAALSTWNGDVWIVSGIDRDLKNLRWTRFATGLFDPLGLKVVDGVIHTLGRDQITRLHDLNGDGEADHYECFNNDVLITKSFHEFAFDLQTDAEGNFYFSKGGPVRPGGRGFDKIVPHHGCVLKRAPRTGQQARGVYATGLRAPNGIGVGPNGEVTSGDNEGTWMPACRLNWIKPGSFNGCVDTSHRNPRADDVRLRRCASCR